MLRIACPHCGSRDHTEFVYGGDASQRRPDTAFEIDDATWNDYLYARDDPAGLHVEHWHHTLGCRQWLTVARDTTTNRVVEVRPPASAETEPGP